MRGQVLAHLKKSILDGRLEAGTRLVETQVAQELGVSRTPVRESLHLLENEGLLETAPGGGYRVRGTSWKEVEEICAIRVVNETLAAEWALERISAEELKLLEQNLRRTEAEVNNGHLESFGDRDAEFHEILARAAGSERLLELCQMLRRHMLRYRIKAVYEKESGLTAVEGHRRILDCLRRRDEACLRQAVRRHIEESKEDVRVHVFLAEKREARDA